MIQRIQSIYLLLVVAVTAVMVFIPIAEFIYMGESITLKATGIVAPEGVIELVKVNTIPIIGILALIGLLAFVSIFMFKKRMVQIKVNRFNILLNCCYVALVYFLFIDQLSEAFELKKQASLIKLAFPAVNIILLFLANRSIRKDENLVKAADRLR